MDERLVQPARRNWTFVIAGALLDAVCLYMATTAQSPHSQLLFLYLSILGMYMSISYYLSPRGLFGRLF